MTTAILYPASFSDKSPNDGSSYIQETTLANVGGYDTPTYGAGALADSDDGNYIDIYSPNGSVYFVSFNLDDLPASIGGAPITEAYLTIRHFASSGSHPCYASVNDTAGTLLDSSGATNAVNTITTITQTTQYLHNFPARPWGGTDWNNGVIAISASGLSGATVRIYQAFVTLTYTSTPTVGLRAG